MRRRPSPAFPPRRALAVAGLVLLGSGVLMLTSAVHPGGAAASASSPAGTLRAAAHQPRAVKPTRAADRRFEAQVKQLSAAAHAIAPAHSSATVTGPHMYDPQTGQQFPTASTVTVSQTTSLVNQMVQVQWTNFTPSTTLAYGANITAYPVMVAECNGTNPASPADCYGAEDAGVASSSGTTGPPNTSYATTGSNGTGLANIVIQTVVENSSLHCDQGHSCSLAIVPSQGGNYSGTQPNCADHTQDIIFGSAGSAFGYEAFGNQEFACSWAKRIVVPLTFARTAATCPFSKTTAFSVEGSPMLSRAMNSWVAALCVGSHGLFINYNSQSAETQAVNDVASGAADVALTTRSASSQQISTGTRKFVYAPVGVSAAVVAYWFDNPTTGLAQTGVELNQRLVAKMLTQSYAVTSDGCPSPQNPPPLFGCDNGVDGNPVDMFADPDFQTLNPNVVAPADADSWQSVPIVQQGLSDMTWTVTNWIAANKHGADFIKGQFDPWGHHVNTNYLSVPYPTNQFTGQDPYAYVAHAYAPVFPLNGLNTGAVTDMAANWPPATGPQKDQFGNYDRYPNEIPGQRSLVAVLDEADAAAFLFPTAKLANGANRYVTPTNAHMLAALQSTTSDGGTKLVNPTIRNKKAYPLTMVIYAMVPTSGTSHAKAVAIARFLDFAAGAGQTPGVQPGQLPPGYAPLPASMRAQTRKDANAVLHQTGASAPTNNNNNTSPGTSSSPSNGSGSNKGSVSLPAIGPSPGAPSNGISLVNTADVHPASITRYILPALLILGGLAALGGSSSLAGSSSTPIAARLRRIGQAPTTWSRTMRTRLGSRRSK